MAFSKETTDLLNSGVPFHDRQGPRGVTFKYVKTEDVIQRLNDAFNHCWSSQVISTETSGDFVMVLLQVEAEGIAKQAYGGAQTMRSRKDNSIIDLANAYKSAFANALKGAAKQFGVGLNEDEDVPEVLVKKYTPSPRPAVVVRKTEQPKESPKNPSSSSSKPDVSVSASTSVKVEKTVSSKDDMLKKAHAMMKKAQEEEKKVPEVTTPFPTTNTDDSTATDIQITAIQKLCARAQKTEKVLFEEAREQGVIKSDATTAKQLKKSEGAAMIRFLTHTKTSNA